MVVVYQTFVCCLGGLELKIKFVIDHHTLRKEGKRGGKA